MNLVFPHTFVPWFRTVAPHIHAHHGKTFVVAIAGELIAAGKLDIPTIAVRTGGFGTDELQEAGAAHVFDSLEELHAALDETALAVPSRAA